MYKSKLQEYCQSEAWNLPEYSTIKEGLDHCPQFKACVIVNGATFSTPHFSKSSKEAQNLAAKLAFDHLLGSSSSSPSSPSIPAGFSSSSPSLPSIPACSDVQQPKTKETCDSSLGGINSLSRDHKKSKDVGHFYKSQLQTYAQRRNLLLPVYVTEREGPPHQCCFKSKVTIDEKTYESPEYFLTVKDAENAAAKVALMATSSNGNEEEDPVFYKNLLQELAQKEYACLPVYSTLSCGSCHMPRFISTVEVKNESFTGQEAKTKKLAELDAAKVALKECLQKQNSMYHSPISHVKDLSLCSSPKEHWSHVVESSQQAIPESVLRPCETSTEQARCNRGVYQKVTESEPDVLEPQVRPGSANSSVADQSTSRSDVIGNTEEPARSGPLKLYKKVKVQPQDPNMTFPPGTVIMHSDTKWVAVTNFDSIRDNA